MPNVTDKRSFEDLQDFAIQTMALVHVSGLFGSDVMRPVLETLKRSFTTSAGNFEADFEASSGDAEHPDFTGFLDYGFHTRVTSTLTAAMPPTLASLERHCKRQYYRQCLHIVEYGLVSLTFQHASRLGAGTRLTGVERDMNPLFVLWLCAKHGPCAEHKLLDKAGQSLRHIMEGGHMHVFPDWKHDSAGVAPSNGEDSKGLRSPESTVKNDKSRQSGVHIAKEVEPHTTSDYVGFCDAIIDGASDCGCTDLDVDEDVYWDCDSDNMGEIDYPDSVEDEDECTYGSDSVDDEDDGWDSNGDIDLHQRW